jgi:hypothetical protein
MEISKLKDEKSVADFCCESYVKENEKMFKNHQKRGILVTADALKIIL